MGRRIRLIQDIPVPGRKAAPQSPAIVMGLESPGRIDWQGELL
jgi:hypothetical protein